MSETGKGIGIFLAGLAGILILFAVLDITGLAWQSFIAPKREAVRRQVWEQSLSHQKGMRKDLVKYMHEYNTAETESAKDGIASLVRLNYADFSLNENDNQELKDFLQECFNRTGGQKK